MENEHTDTEYEARISDMVHKMFDALRVCESAEGESYELKQNTILPKDVRRAKIDAVELLCGGSYQVAKSYQALLHQMIDGAFTDAFN